MTSTMLTSQPRIKPYVPKAPAQRAYAPKSADPGQRITWTRSAGYATTETRTGIIWSTGALPMSVWAQPDDGSGMALVMLRSMTEHPAYPPSWQRDTITRCQHLATSGGMFAEYKTETRYEYGRGNVDHPHTVAYHCDRACPEIRHETRECWDWEPTTGYVIRMLLDATARGRSDLCRHCIYLSESAEVCAA